MNFQILPNRFKKVGLILFIVFSALASKDSIVRGFNAGYNYNRTIPETVKSDSLVHVTESTITQHYLSVISIIGIIIYLMSKEKIEDDYINKLRLESYQLTALISLFAALILFIFSSQLKFYLDDFITMFLFVYLITFYIKKRIDL